MRPRAAYFRDLTPPSWNHSAAGWNCAPERGVSIRGGRDHRCPHPAAGTVLHKDRVSLASDRERKRFVREALAAAPGT